MKTMTRFGKCLNLSGCLLAYRGEETEVFGEEPFVCVECGKALCFVESPAVMWRKYVTGLCLVGLVSGLGWVGVRVWQGGKKAEVDGEGLRRQAIISARETNGKSGEVVGEPRAVDIVKLPVEEDVAAVTVPEKLAMDLSQKENQRVKDEVLRRVDLMPKVSNPKRDKLYAAVERARRMGMILRTPFGSGKSDLGVGTIAKMKEALEQPEVSDLRADPTAVFVVLGYADTNGDPEKNLVVSRLRAETVARAMRENCGMMNVIHSIGMGGSKLLDEKNMEKNRIVEIWAVLP